MFSIWLSRIVRRPARATKSARPPRCRLSVEALEDRWLPAPLFTWTGNDPTSDAWGSPNNWRNESGNAQAPTAGANLLFDSTAVRYFSKNDFSAGTEFASLTISRPFAAGFPTYFISGAAIEVGPITVSDGVGSTLALNLTGSNGLTKDGLGTLFLSGANSYRAGTTLNAGTLSVNDGASIGSAPLVLNGGTFQSTFTSVTLGNAVRLAGNVTFGGSAPLTFAGPVTLAAFSGLVVQNTTTTFAAQITESTGNLGLVKSGLGTLVLAAANFYSGSTFLAAGTLAVGNDGALGGGSLFVLGGPFPAGQTIQAFGGPRTLGIPVGIGVNLTFGGADGLTLTGQVTLNSTCTLTVTNPAATLTLTGAINESNGAQTLRKDGAGTLVLRAASTYTAGTAVLAGTLIVGQDRSLGVDSGNGLHQLTLAGGTIQAENAPVTLDHRLFIAGAATVGGSFDVTFTGSVSLFQNPQITVARPGVTVTLRGVVADFMGPQILIKDGPGTLLLAAANEYTVATVLQAGTLLVGNDRALGPTGALILNGGTITPDFSSRLLANPVTILQDTTLGNLFGTLTLTGPVVLVGNRTVTLNGAVSIAGTISSPQSAGSSLTVSGGPSGVLTLAGNNTFTAGLTLNGAILFLTNEGNVGGGPLAINGGTVLIGSDRTLANPVTLGGNVTFGGASNLTFAGQVTLTGTRVVTLNAPETTLTLAGAIVGDEVLIKDGPGMLVLTGPTNAARGIVLLAGSLAGSGAAGALTTAGGQVRPGGLGTGIFSAAGTVSLLAGSSLIVDLNGTTAGTTHDQLNVTSGTVNLGGSTLSVILGVPPAAGDSYTIVNNQGAGPVVGIFRDLPEGASLTLGQTTLQITYKGGDGNDVVLSNRKPTTTEVTVSFNPAVFGQSLVFMATVRVGAQGTGTPVGTVTFLDGAVPLGAPVPLSGGSAILTTLAPVVGGHLITGVYSGNAAFSGSSSAAVLLVVNRADTTTTVATTPSPSPLGAPALLTAAVRAAAPGAGVPAGMVTFKEGMTTLGTAPLDGTGQATLSLSTLGVGPHAITAVFLGEGNFKGSTSPTVRQLVGSKNQRFVAQAYLDVLGRPVDAGGLSRWTGLLDQGTTRPQVVRMIQASTEYRQLQVRTVFQAFLGRDPDPGGLSTFVNRLRGGATLEQVQADVVASGEYFQKRGGRSNAGFVTALFRDALGRTIDPATRAAFVQRIVNGTSRRQIATTVFTSQEYRARTVTQLVQQFLRRGPDGRGFVTILQALNGGRRVEDVGADLVGSTEYYGRV